MTKQIYLPDDSTVAKALAIIAEASETSRGFFRSPVGVEFKADESPVTIADRAVEAEIRAALSAAFPDYGIFGEEHGIEGEGRDDMWIVDPIDGTRSFISGNPLFGMLLALVHKGQLVMGVIGMPALGETYVGVPGRGATMNGSAISVSSQTKLADAIININEGERIFSENMPVFERLMRCGQTCRFAYDCYPHALVASGYVDVVVDYDLKPYDYLPVAGVVQAAGGIMTDWQGKALDFNSDGRVVSAATPELHRDMLQVLNGGGA